MAASTSAALDALLVGPDFHANPYPAYRRLREEAPVFWSEVRGEWLLTRHADVAATLRDPRRFTKVGHVTRRLDRLPAVVLDRIGPLYRNFSQGLVVSDPPEHTRIRGLANRAFTPTMIASMRDHIQDVIDRLIEPLLDREEIDVVGDFAYPLPAIVVFEMLGFPLEIRDQFKAWSNAIVAFHGTGQVDAEVVEQSNAALIQARTWIEGEVADRRRAHRDDVLSALVAAEERGDSLSSEELISTVITLATAGHETTTGLIANGLLALSRNPDQRELLRGDSDLVGPAVEEMLRYDPPFHRTWRVTTTTVVISGTTIPEGAIVAQLLAAANRDPDVVDRPDVFDITRPAVRHLSFGFGTHFCLGNPLARLETQLAIPTLLRRLGDLAVDESRLRWNASDTFHSPAFMPAAVQRRA